MGQIRVLAHGTTPQQRAQARGKLFERLVAGVLRVNGYDVLRTPNVNYAGMEIDIEGTSTIAKTPLYAECKCYETEVESHKLQAFFGNYMTRWLKDQKCQGLFVALPGVNSHARGFYRDNCEMNRALTVRLLEESDVIKAIVKSGLIVPAETVSRTVSGDMGSPGDQVMLYTDEGLFWVQYIIPRGAALVTQVAVFDSRGTLISDKTSLDSLRDLMPELSSFETISTDFATTPGEPRVTNETDEIVEVRGSTACFEYQFPASPDHFVGRESILQDVAAFALSVVQKRTSSRAIVFEGDSGFGKSSVVLASVAHLRELGHLAVAVDSRTASSSQFVLRLAEYVLQHLSELGDCGLTVTPSRGITGFEGATSALIEAGQLLETQGKVLFIFLDQFENIFFLADALRRIRDVLLRLCDRQTNVVLGFSWKTDLIGLASEFPYKTRDTIISASKEVFLERFSDSETKALLNRLSVELKAHLRKDLQFLLSEFSQGYPWLLKRLCAHVKTQREAGVSQSDIALGLLNIEDLFKEDLRGLSSEEEDTLRRIAKEAPISFPQLSEEFDSGVVQSLLHRRLIVKIGSKYDVYWDIFRDYLNSNRIPVQENYMVRLQVGTVLRATRLLAESGGSLLVRDLQTRTESSSEKSVYNMIREMKVLGLANLEDGALHLTVPVPDVNTLEETIKAHLRERLKRNRLIWMIMLALEGGNQLSIDDVSRIISESCPYISATTGTWRTYGQILVTWLNFADLAVLDTRTGTLTSYRPEIVREKGLLPARRRRSIMLPLVQYSPITRIVGRILNAVLQSSTSIDWTDLKRSTIYKSLATLELLGFIRWGAQTIELLPRGFEFALKPEERIRLFSEGALKMDSFRTFVDVLHKYHDNGRTLVELATELGGILGVKWRTETGKTNVKIMLDWARNLNLAPGVFAERRRGPFKGWRRKGQQIGLFEE